MSKQKLNCGSCLFHEREKTFDHSCNALGKLPTSVACGSYKPNMFSLVGTAQKFDRMEKLAESIYGMSATELQALGAVMYAERNTRKAGWRFMQKVYVRYTGSSNHNYLGNFLLGYVLYADKEYIRIVGNSGKVFLTIMNEQDSNTIYTVNRFKALRDNMIAAKRFTDPDLRSRGFNPRNVMPLDEAPLQDNVLRKSVKKSRASEDDLVSIISRMQRGIIGRGGSRVKRPAKEGSEIVIGG
jgi:hypothetical protein